LVASRSRWNWFGAGQIVGAAQVAGSTAHHAFLYSGGQMTDLGTLGGVESQANAINRAGLIAGWSQTADGRRHAILWQAGHKIDLNSRIAIAPDVWLVEATAVNDIGQIVANANNGHAYLMAVSFALE
jgi:probable HAF family extracellular repeat protein